MRPKTNTGLFGMICFCKVYTISVRWDQALHNLHWYHSVISHLGNSTGVTSAKASQFSMRSCVPCFRRTAAGPADPPPRTAPGAPGAAAGTRQSEPEPQADGRPAAGSRPRQPRTRPGRCCRRRRPTGSCPADWCCPSPAPVPGTPDPARPPDKTHKHTLVNATKGQNCLISLECRFWIYIFEPRHIK